MNNLDKKRMEEKKVVEAVLNTITNVKSMDNMPDEAYNALTAVEKSLVGMAGLIYDMDYTVMNEDVKRSVFDYELMELDTEDFIVNASKTKWTKFELDRLKELASLGVAWADIAASLHRTVSACRSKYLQLQRNKKPVDMVVGK